MLNFEPLITYKYIKKSIICFEIIAILLTQFNTKLLKLFKMILP